MLKNIKIGMKLGIGFGLVILFMMAVAYDGISGMNTMGRDLAKIDGEVEKIDKAQLVLKETNTVVQSLNAYVASDDPSRQQEERETLRGAQERAGRVVDELEEELPSEGGQQRLRDISAARDAFDSEVDVILDLVDSGDDREATAHLMNEAEEEQAAYLGAVEELVNYQQELMAEVQSEAREAQERATTTMMWLTGAALILSVLIGWAITRSITRPIAETRRVMERFAEGDLTVEIQSDRKDEIGQLMESINLMLGRLSQIIAQVKSAGDALASASEEVSSTSQNLSQGSSEQASSVEETTSSIEQMTASIGQNTENAKATDSMASKAASEAQEGGTAVNETVDAMKSIAEKISIIDDIAYQTNLLALNAAIEAARAGEHGKGFAVVAAEVRKLAERSQVAAQEISEVAKNSVGLAERAGKLLDEMVPSIQKTSDLVQEISAASEEQNTGASQINSAMEQLNSITQQSASSSEELAATAEEMSGQAENLQQMMAFFKLGDEPGQGVKKSAQSTQGGSGQDGSGHGHAQRQSGQGGKNSGQRQSADGDESEFVRF